MNETEPQSSAVSRVFGTTELLENILLQLGESNKSAWRDLFVVQRVSRRFQAVIYASPSLRRTMFLEPPNRPLDSAEVAHFFESYRAFFTAIQSVLFPFWCHLRHASSDNAEAFVLALNISLFWQEESPGCLVGRGPGGFDGSKAIEQHDSWRKLFVPYHPGQQVELHCCGYPVQDSITEGITLGELADKAMRAGSGHLDGLQPVRYFG
ncbi:Hypothetical predicted protein [Lecanosticta acicola]|uniref:F-box domain-containing protein n=1 Tax=Lecanosticta acicola TaxID=111012 RepID=A0AAI8YSN9_9PEZI|nr:Hypothetical predicted protein [Lecanosticta acicola]